MTHRDGKFGPQTFSTASPAPGIFVTRVTGHFDEALARQVVRAGEEVRRKHGKLLAFHDWQGALTYESATRKLLTDWGYAIRNDVERVHILVGSKLVKMAVSVASIVLLGMLVSYDDPEAFERELRVQVEARKALPSPPL